MIRLTDGQRQWVFLVAGVLNLFDMTDSIGTLIMGLALIEWGAHAQEAMRR